MKNRSKILSPRDSQIRIIQANSAVYAASGFNNLFSSAKSKLKHVMDGISDVCSSALRSLFPPAEISVVAREFPENLTRLESISALLKGKTDKPLLMDQGTCAPTPDRFQDFPQGPTFKKEVCFVPSRLVSNKKAAESAKSSFFGKAESKKNEVVAVRLNNETKESGQGKSLKRQNESSSGKKFVEGKEFFDEYCKDYRQKLPLIISNQCLDEKKVWKKIEKNENVSDDDLKDKKLRNTESNDIRKTQEKGENGTQSSDLCNREVGKFNGEGGRQTSHQDSPNFYKQELSSSKINNNDDKGDEKTQIDSNRSEIKTSLIAEKSSEKKSTETAQNPFTDTSGNPFKETSGNLFKETSANRVEAGLNSNISSEDISSRNPFSQLKSSAGLTTDPKIEVSLSSNPLKSLKTDSEPLNSGQVKNPSEPESNTLNSSIKGVENSPKASKAFSLQTEDLKPSIPAASSLNNSSASQPEPQMNEIKAKKRDSNDKIEINSGVNQATSSNSSNPADPSTIPILTNSIDQSNPSNHSISSNPSNVLNPLKDTNPTNSSNPFLANTSQELQKPLYVFGGAKMNSSSSVTNNPSVNPFVSTVSPKQSPFTSSVQPQLNPFVQMSGGPSSSNPFTQPSNPLSQQNHLIQAQTVGLNNFSNSSMKVNPYAAQPVGLAALSGSGPSFGQGVSVGPVGGQPIVNPFSSVSNAFSAQPNHFTPGSQNAGHSGGVNPNPFSAGYSGGYAPGTNPFNKDVQMTIDQPSSFNSSYSGQYAGNPSNSSATGLAATNPFASSGQSGINPRPQFYQSSYGNSGNASNMGASGGEFTLGMLNTRTSSRFQRNR